MDAAGWLSINKDNGQILVKNSMDRESHFVIDGKYTALIAAVDSGKPCFSSCPVWEQTGRVGTAAYLMEQKNLHRKDCCIL